MWRKISKDSTKAFKMFCDVYFPNEGETTINEILLPQFYFRRLYDLFDDNGIYIDIEPAYRLLDDNETGIIFYPFIINSNGDDLLLEKVHFHTRDYAEKYAIEKAFAILEVLL